MNQTTREFNWSTYQDRQLETLLSIEKLLETQLTRSKILTTYMSKVEYTLESIAKELVSDTEKFSKGLEDAAKSTDILMKQAESAGNKLHRLSRQVSDASEHISNFSKNISDVGTILSNAFNILGGLRGIGNEVDNYSNLSNQMIKITGMPGAIVREVKNDILSTIDGINARTGAYFNSQDAYRSIIEFTRGVTSNTDAILELSEPLLLANETLDANIGDIADIFNRFYTRYTFSSESMKNVLDDIRGNTAGNSANAEATLKNITSLENWINNYARDDNVLREKLLESVSHYTSWVESMGLDSNKFTDYLNAAAYGDYAQNKELLTILNLSNISTAEATKLAQSGQYEELTEAMMNGIYTYMKKYDLDGNGKIDDTYALGRSLDNIGIDRNLAMDIWNTMNSKGFVSLEDFLQNVEDTPTTDELVEDKYVSAADKIRNTWLEKIYSTLASVQEDLGFGLSDIALAIALLNGTNLSSRIRGFGSRSLGSLSTSPLMRGTGLLGGLEAGGASLIPGLSGVGAAAVGAGGVLAGGLLAYDGLQDLINWKNNDATTNVLSGAEIAGGAGAMLGIAGAFGAASGPIGWTALAVAAAAYAGKEIHEAITPISGAAKNVEVEFDKLSESFEQEQMKRVSQLQTLEDSILLAKDDNEATKLAIDSGLLPLEENMTYTTSALLDMIDGLQETTGSLIALHDASLEAAEQILADKAKEEDEKVAKEIYDKFKGLQNSNGWIDKNSEGYNEAKILFTQLAKSITDEKAREAAIADVNKIFEDDRLTDAELQFLTDQGGNFLAAISPELDRKDNIFRQSRDIRYNNQTLSLLGLEGYDTSQSDLLSNMDKILMQWSSATNDDKKLDYAEQYKELLESVEDPTLKSMLESKAREYGIIPYARGSNYIPYNQIALLHEGEAVVPKAYNPAAGYQTDEILEYFTIFIEELREIKDFLQSWKEDNNKSRKFSEIRSANNISSKLIRQYMIARN